MEDWNKIIARLTGPDGLSEAAQSTPSIALREDAFALLTLSRYAGGLLKTLKKGRELNEPFSSIMKELDIKNEFVINWLDMLCFLLQGLPASGTMNAVMAYMMADWYRPGVTLDFPKGGSGAIVEALVRGLEKAGKGGEGGGRGSGKLMLRTHCEQVDPPRLSLLPLHCLTMPQILVRDGRAVGVLLRDQITGKKTEAFATKAVVSNIDFYNLRKLVPVGVSATFDEALEAYATSVPPLASFIHLHAGIDATDLPTYHNLT